MTTTTEGGAHVVAVVHRTGCGCEYVIPTDPATLTARGWTQAAVWPVAICPAHMPDPLPFDDEPATLRELAGL